MKRLCDILLSLFGLVILCPLLLAVSIWIVADSRGGVFYRQARVGRGNRDFSILKFRTMHTGSDRQGLLTVGGHDSRVTLAGYWLRKYKIDELPQLWNVLRGDMSFVGPRPEVRKYVDLYSPEQLHVLDVRPGITDAASIKYRNENDLLAKAEDPEKYYIETIMPDKLLINLEYVKKHTLWGDCRLVLQTLKAI